MKKRRKQKETKRPKKQASALTNMLRGNKGCPEHLAVLMATIEEISDDNDIEALKQRVYNKILPYRRYMKTDPVFTFDGLFKMAMYKLVEKGKIDEEYLEYFKRVRWTAWWDNRSKKL